MSNEIDTNVTITATGYISLRAKVSPKKPYTWTLYVRSNGKELTLMHIRPLPLFSTVQAAMDDAKHYAESFGITITSWEGVTQ